MKVNGRTEKWPLERVLAEAQKSHAAQERFQQAAREKQEILRAREQFKQNPDAFIKAMGFDNPTDFYRSNFAAKMRESMMTPEQREQAARERELEELRREKQGWQEKEKQARLEKEQAAAAQRFESGWKEALAAAKLKETPHLTRMAAQMAMDELEAGQEPNWHAIAQGLKEQFHGGYRESLESLEDDDALEELLGPKVAERVRKAALKKIAPRPGGAGPALSAATAPKPVDKRQMTPDEFREYMEQMKRGAL